VVPELKLGPTYDVCVTYDLGVRRAEL